MPIRLFTLIDENGRTSGIQIVADNRPSYADLCELILNGFDCLAAPTEAQRAIRDAIFRNGPTLSTEQGRLLKVKPPFYRVYAPTEEDKALCAGDSRCGDYLYRKPKGTEL